MGSRFQSYTKAVAGAASAPLNQKLAFFSSPHDISNGSRLRFTTPAANWGWTPGERKPVAVSGAIAKYIFQFL